MGSTFVTLELTIDEAKLVADSLRMMGTMFQEPDDSTAPRYMDPDEVIPCDDILSIAEMIDARITEATA